jgi:hypothetical protein
MVFVVEVCRITVQPHPYPYPYSNNAPGASTCELAKRPFHSLDFPVTIHTIEHSAPPSPKLGNTFDPSSHFHWVPEKERIITSAEIYPS